MTDRVTASDPTPGQIIREIHAWIATYPDGSEGIMAAGVQGIGMTPLLSSRLELAKSMEPLARKTQRETMRHPPHWIVSIRLVTFTISEAT
jgi:hypothetical protein